VVTLGVRFRRIPCVNRRLHSKCVKARTVNVTSGSKHTLESSVRYETAEKSLTSYGVPMKKWLPPRSSSVPRRKRAWACLTTPQQRGRSVPHTTRSTTKNNMCLSLGGRCPTLPVMDTASNRLSVVQRHLTAAARASNFELQLPERIDTIALQCMLDCDNLQSRQQMKDFMRRDVYLPYATCMHCLATSGLEMLSHVQEVRHRP
jgi:hypothetical protein